MDHIDLKILDALKMNSRATASEISKQVSLSVPAISERLRKLEEGGIIEQYTLRTNRIKMGYHLLSMVFVNVDQTMDITGFKDAVLSFPEVLECHHMAGEYDYMLKVLLEDTGELEHFISEKLKTIKGVKKSNTLIVLSTVKEQISR